MANKEIIQRVQKFLGDMKLLESQKKKLTQKLLEDIDAMSEESDIQELDQLIESLSDEL